MVHYASAQCGASRYALMTAWFNGTNAQLAAVAKSFFNELKAMPRVEAKTRDQYWREYVDPPIVETRAAMLETNLELPSR